ncbi:MAG: hypothetical protein M3Z96_10420 [Pseudomonadota bacterium]|nr:hypothetical protein [Pseudomonadota bacterium]
MDAKDLLPILFERSNATATLWNIEIAVFLGLIAFVASARETMDHWFPKLALTVGFVGMAVLHARSLIEVAEQRRALVDFFRTLSPPVLGTSPECIDPLYVGPVNLGCIDPLYVGSANEVVAVHLVGDLLVVLFIWFYSRLNKHDT